jgi:hypothetical protein
MSRKKRGDSRKIEKICRRLLSTLQDNFEMSLATISSALEYSNGSTVTRIKRGTVIPDPLRLARFAARLGEENGRTINLHWVLTGEGMPVIPHGGAKTASPSSADYDFIKLYSTLAESQKSALVTLLTGSTLRAESADNDAAHPDGRRRRLGT